MPYRRAWLFVALLLAATVLGFWRSYFSILSTTSIGFHVHGITASLWMLLLLAQSWTPHNGRLALHRQLGKAIFVALPLFAAGSMAVIHSMAVATRDGDPFYALWGAPLAFIDLLALSALLYAAGMALRHRRNVRLHAGYMLSTALPLVSPVFGRVFNQTIPGLIMQGPKDFPLFGWSAQLGNLLAWIIALWLWRRDPRFGRPWAVALAVVVVQMVGFELLGTNRAWHTAFLAIGLQPLAVLILFGLAAGVATVLTAWRLPAPREGRRGEKRRENNNLP